MKTVILSGDITAQSVDAIVNAANSSLLGGGGVDGAIHVAAGPALLQECRRLRATSLPDGLAAGSAVATEAGRLKARWVIHAVGPNRHAGQIDPAVLASCFTSSLDVAAGLGARSIAFPAIGAGVYGWAASEVASLAAAAVRAWSQARGGDTPGGGITEVRFVLFGAETEEAFRRAFA